MPDEMLTVTQSLPNEIEQQKFLPTKQEGAECTEHALLNANGSAFPAKLQRIAGIPTNQTNGSKRGIRMKV
jgi:hypothetical protein